LLIVAHALALAQIVIAEEQREFLRIQDLWGETSCRSLMMRPSESFSPRRRTTP